MESAELYRKFWEELSPAYPISKGAFKLPIATNLITIDETLHRELVAELKIILEELLSKHGTKESAIKNATAAGEERIIPLLSNDFTGVVRFDCVIDQNTNTPKILEINCDYPDGLILHDKTFGVLSGSTSTLHQDGLHSLLKESEDITILHSPHASFVDGYHAEKEVLDSVFEKPVSIGHAIDYTEPKTIRRCLEVSKLTHDDCEALAVHDHTYLNTFALRTLGYKDLLSSISHTHIPKTILLTEANFADFFEDKDRWVMKPVEGCEGNGILFGKDLSQDEWENVVREQAALHYIMQEFITLSRYEVSLYENGTISKRELYFDMCPYFFIKQGQVVGNGYTLMRFSEHPIVNVTKGGGIGYHTF